MKGTEMTNENKLIEILDDIRFTIQVNSIGSPGTAPGILESGIMRLLDQQSAATEELRRIADALEIFVKIAQKQSLIDKML
jgi:hypothetical protein